MQIFQTRQLLLEASLTWSHTASDGRCLLRCIEIGMVPKVPMAKDQIWCTTGLDSCRQMKQKKKKTTRLRGSFGKSSATYLTTLKTTKFFTTLWSVSTSLHYYTLRQYRLVLMQCHSLPACLLNHRSLLQAKCFKSQSLFWTKNTHSFPIRRDTPATMLIQQDDLADASVHHRPLLWKKKSSVIKVVVSH